MGPYMIRRVLLIVPAWLLMSIATFAVIHAIPGDPAAALVGVDASQEQYERVRERLGLDEPLPAQYGKWLRRTVSGDLGQSLFLGRPVLQVIADRLPITLSLTAFALTIAILVGVPAGMFAARRAGRWPDLTVMASAMLALSVPDFALGLVLSFIVGVELRMLPIGGYVPLSADPAAWVAHLLLPALTLGLSQAALVARMTRSSMLEVAKLDYVRTAAAKGVGEARLVLRHVFMPAIIPVITVVGTIAAVLLGGTFIVETVFNLPGIGDMVVNGVKRRDYPVVQGGILLIATIIILVNLLVDALYTVCDPRIRYT